MSTAQRRAIKVGLVSPENEEEGSDRGQEVGFVPAAEKGVI